MVSAKNYIFRLLKIRLYSEKEILEKLKKRKFAEDVTRQTIRYFKQLGLIDDRQFAQKWISARLAKPTGPQRIQLELKQKGIDPEILREELTQATKNYSEKEMAEQLAKKRALLYRDLEEMKKKQRIYRYLAYRGFNLEVIQQVLKEIV